MEYQKLHVLTLKSNYSAWASRIKDTLEMVGCQSMIQHRANPNEREMDILARSKIKESISDEILEKVLDCQTAYDLWKKIEKLFADDKCDIDVISNSMIGLI